MRTRRREVEALLRLDEGVEDPNAQLAGIGTARLEGAIDLEDYLGHFVRAELRSRNWERQQLLVLRVCGKRSDDLVPCLDGDLLRRREEVCAGVELNIEGSVLLRVLERDHRPLLRPFPFRRWVFGGDFRRMPPVLVYE